ncbi:hypothetical protein [Pseudomonas sp. NPDC008258]|uniref:hypothetical protein n=1 Tax=Pseudomonas sp. NPDC008258 TaxID=3364418 RepID=UPI0036EC315D
MEFHLGDAWSLPPKTYLQAHFVCNSHAVGLFLETVRTYGSEDASMTATNLPVMTTQEWRQLLNDTEALLQAPRKHHLELLHQAYPLPDTHAADSGTLVDMSELADEALMYAHSVQPDQQW